MIDQKTALELFEYREGKLYWRVCLNNRAPIGSEAGTYNQYNKRRSVRIKGKQYYTHRLIFLIHHGHMPLEVDHIDADRHNNRIENLRAASPSENQRNKPRQRNNTSGRKNVRWVNGKWAVELKINGKARYFGRFEDLELAALMASEVRDKYYGEFANHG